MPNQQQPPQQQGTDLDALLRQTRSTVTPLVDAIEKRRNSTVITYFVRDGTPISEDGLQFLYEHLRRLGRQEQIDLFLYSRGGQTEAPWGIVNLIREFTDKFCVLLPYHAESAATHIATGANEIVMTEIAQLGPVDPARRHPLLPPDPHVPEGEDPRPLAISVQDLRHFVQFIEKEGEENKGVRPEDATEIYTALMAYVHPLVIGAMEQTYTLAQQLTRKMLSLHMDPEMEKDEIERLAKTLADDFKSHQHPIPRSEAKRLGLKVVYADDALRDEMWTLYQYYVQQQMGGEVLQETPAGRRELLVNGVVHMDSRAGTAVACTMQEKKTGKMAGGLWLQQFDQPAGATP